MLGKSSVQKCKVKAPCAVSSGASRLVFSHLTDRVEWDDEDGLEIDLAWKVRKHCVVMEEKGKDSRINRELPIESHRKLVS